MIITIKEMTKSDPPLFARIDKECFAVPWSEKAFEDEYKNDIAIYFSAECSGECVGYIGFWNVSGEGDITNIAVRKSFRRIGVGSKLIEAVIKKAKDIGISILTLEVRSSNISAQSLYKKYGFEVIGTRKGYYSDNGEDALIMTKTILLGDFKI